MNGLGLIFTMQGQMCHFRLFEHRLLTIYEPDPHGLFLRIASITTAAHKTCSGEG